MSKQTSTEIKVTILGSDVEGAIKAAIKALHNFDGSNDDECLMDGSVPIKEEGKIIGFLDIDCIFS